MSRATADEIRALGYRWPISATVDGACSELDGQIDLDATLAMLERNLAYYKREQSEMFAFAARWNADVDDVTNRRDDVADAIWKHDEALAAVRTLRDLFDQPPAQRRPRTPTPPPPEPTAESLAVRAARVAEIERRNAPLPRAAVAELLATYFDGPSDAAVIDRLLVAANGPITSRYRDARGGALRWRTHRGQAWLEELADGDDEWPSRLHIAALIAATDAGYPAPRWYRPRELVGIWIEDAPEGPVRWQLAATGEFSTTASPLSKRARWSVHRLEQRLLLRESDDDFSATALRITTITGARIEVEYLGMDGPELHGLRREDPT